MCKVLVIQRRLTHYRVPFFVALLEEMKAQNLELILAYGEPSSSELKKNDSGLIPTLYDVSPVAFIFISILI